MKIIKPSFIIETTIDSNEILRRIEHIVTGSDLNKGKITTESAYYFVSSLLDTKNESAFEHISVTVRFICSKCVADSLFMGKTVLFTCNLSYKEEVEFIKPVCFLDNTLEFDIWENLMLKSEEVYNQLLEIGKKPEQADIVLCDSVKTEVVVTMNLRQWKDFLTTRCHETTKPDIKQITIPLLKVFNSQIPLIFSDIEFDQEFSAKNYAQHKTKSLAAAVFGLGGTPASA